MLSLWPAGLSSNGEGTIDWAGGLINWNSPLMKNGYYYAMFSDITVKCYDPPAGASVSGSKSYVYTNVAATNQSINVSNDFTILGSLAGTGENPGTKPQSASSSSTPESIPGVSGVGARGDTGSSSSSSSGSSSGGSGFIQGTGSNSSGAGKNADRLPLGGSAFAVLIAVVIGIIWL
jgi:hypothetical protein